MSVKVRNLIALASILLLAVPAEPIVTNQHLFDLPTGATSTSNPEPLSTGRLWRFDIDRSPEAFNDVIELINVRL